MLSTDILPPQEFVFGDNWNLEISADKYPASKGYVLTLTVIPVKEGPSFQIVSDPTITGEAGKHLLAFVGDTLATAGAHPGDYRGQVVITLPGDATVRKTAGFFDLTIMPDYSLNYTDGYDPRSYNEKCLESLEQVLAGQAGRDLLEYTFKDASFKYKPISELVSLRNYFMKEVEREQGKKSGRYITKSLSRPTYWGI